MESDIAIDSPHPAPVRGDSDIAVDSPREAPKRPLRVERRKALLIILVLGSQSGWHSTGFKDVVSPDSLGHRVPHLIGAVVASYDFFFNTEPDCDDGRGIMHSSALSVTAGRCMGFVDYLAQDRHPFDF